LPFLARDGGVIAIPRALGWLAKPGVGNRTDNQREGRKVAFGRFRYQCIDHDIFELPYGDASTQSARPRGKRQSVHNPFDVTEALRLIFGVTTLAVGQQLVARQESSLCLCRSRTDHERNGETEGGFKDPNVHHLGSIGSGCPSSHGRAPDHPMIHGVPTLLDLRGGAGDT
jgi:hypothetical protein